MLREKKRERGKMRIHLIEKLKYSLNSFDDVDDDGDDYCPGVFYCGYFMHIINYNYTDYLYYPVSDKRYLYFILHCVLCSV